MTRTPFDSFSKQFFEAFLSPLGTVEISQEIPGESRLVDVRFVPFPQPQIPPQTLGLLGRLATTSCVIEPFRNSPTATEVRSCLLKLFLVQADLQRQAKRENRRLSEDELPKLWILAPSVSDNFLYGFATHRDDR